ncbi:sigma-70 family RNA polymerase sigma factor [Porticoccaceae bacterium LTM1]|nr:sigma-70 family RNA polymerase sigma factor [Porticoccaceae bacterium LTM1]
MRAMSRKEDNVLDFHGRHHKAREKVLEQLFKAHGDALRSFLFGRTGAEDDPDDIVQEVFLRLVKMEGLQTKMADSHARNRAYIFTMANNLIVDIERRKALQRTYTNQLEDCDQVQEITPEAAASAERDLSMLKQVIQEMKPAWRQAFVLNRFKFMSYTQIAKHMGVTVKQVENYMTQALVRVRDAQHAMRGLTRNENDG